MPFPEHLLEQSSHLAHREKRRPRQASLRRAVSTAYYALFHLLISEATLNWKRADQRPLFARFFEHGKMRAASERKRSECNRYLSSKPAPAPGSELDCCRNLLLVAETFLHAQDERHTADYDNSTTWTRAEAIALVKLVEAAFQSWHAIREEPAAQAYLISLLGNPKGV